MTSVVRGKKTCVAPNCDTGLVSVETNRLGKKPSLHRFPADASRKAEWLRAMPKDITLSEDSRLCSLHFTPESYKTEKADQRDERGVSLQLNLLKSTAVPSIWPNCPFYLSRWPEARKTSLATSEAREEAAVKRNIDRDEKEAREGLTLDGIVKQVCSLLPDVTIIRSNSSLALLSVHIGDPKIRYGLKIHVDLKFESFCCDMQMDDGKVYPVNKLLHCRDLLVVFENLEICYQKMTTGKERDRTTVESVVYSLRHSSIAENKKIIFLIEQLELTCHPPKGRRYSASLQAIACLLHTISAACYRKLLQDDILTLPCERHLRRLTNAINVDLEISESTIAYLKARFTKLSEKDKTVAMLLDEVSSDKKVEYSNGKAFGAENDGDITKSLLCIMLSSIAGRYLDIICMSPISSISAEKIHTVWKNCLKEATKIGYDVVITMTDGLEANVKFYKLIAGGDVKIKNPYKLSNLVFLLFDTVHLFKNLYNNLLKYGLFVCPSFKEEEEDVFYTAKFSHVVQIYKMELGNPVKKGHKLTEKVLHPSSIEKHPARQRMFP